jgi:hypothetical protein
MVEAIETPTTTTPFGRWPGCTGAKLLLWLSERMPA